MTLFSVIDSKMDGRYSKFVLPFIALPLLTKQKVLIEVRMTDAKEFIADNKDAISFLQERWTDRFLIADIDTPYWDIVPCGSTMRFVQMPCLKSKWTKISDIDVMHIDKNISKHFDNLELTYGSQHKYFGLKRPDEKKLSGTYVVKTEEFYSEKWRQHLHAYMSEIKAKDSWLQKHPPFDQPHYYYDEYVNWNLVIPVHGEPLQVKGKENDIRPIQGIHMSLNRPAYAPPWQPDRPDWEITQERKRIWSELKETSDYKQVSRFFDPEMIELLDQI